jgi:hypothetical protein
MAKVTKIEVVRNELDRIASAEDRLDAVVPTMKACWSFTRAMVIGKMKSQPFEYDVLLALLKGVPSGTGEAGFWQIVETTNFDEFAKNSEGKLVLI